LKGFFELCLGQIPRQVFTITLTGQPTGVGKWIEPFELSADALKEYAGGHESAELGSRHSLVAKDGKLWIRPGHGEETPLEPVIKDLFTVGRCQEVRVQFLRATGLWTAPPSRPAGPGT
jgi:hypothetical protein